MDILKLQDYNIYIDSGLEQVAAYIEAAQYSAVFVLVDQNTKVHCLAILQKALPQHVLNLIEIPSGEIHKTIQTCQEIWTSLMLQEADRNAVLINLGGGVIGDMGGFCASTFKRGIDFIQIPTTLLSQVDASIGGKLGIDFGQVKNSVGLFKNPKAVFVEAQFLKTLPFDELRSGYAEIIKHSLIADHDQWKQLSQITDLRQFENWHTLISPSLRIKQAIVEKDPFEKGIRKALNFGHTIGHAVESMALETDSPLLHGEAIAIGMVCEAYLSYKQCDLRLSDLQAIKSYLTKVYTRKKLQQSDYSELLGLMQNDKKNHNRQINFTLLTATGTCLVNQTSTDELICESLDYYNK